MPILPQCNYSSMKQELNRFLRQPFQKDGFEATNYDLSTDQLGTQLDPPAHWNPDYPAIDELPATLIIPIQDQFAN
jgi:kynurenine formamidase